MTRGDRAQADIIKGGPLAESVGRWRQIRRRGHLEQILGEIRVVEWIRRPRAENDGGSLGGSGGDAEAPTREVKGERVGIWLVASCELRIGFPTVYSQVTGVRRRYGLDESPL